MIDDTNPAHLEDEAISQEISRLQGIGDLQMDDWVKGSRPATGWNIEAYEKALDTRRSPIPQYPGAQPSAMGTGGWLDQSRAILDNEEGLHSRAYHGATSKARKAQMDAGGDIYVKEGHGSTEEVAVGYGWNMQRKDTKGVFAQILGFSPGDTDAVFNGKKGLDQAQSGKLRDYAIMEVNNSIEKEMKDQPLRDHQRAALVSIAYNLGAGGLRSTGILGAMKAGKPDAEVAKMILAIPSNKERRKVEAAAFLGSQASNFFAQK
jgi:GH24 family phage-related lysozyme (muramidase)